MFRFFYRNFKHKNSGPWNEVIKTSKRVFQSAPNDHTLEPQDESPYYLKIKSYKSSQARHRRVGFRSLHVLRELTRLRRASLVLEM